MAQSIPAKAAGAEIVVYNPATTAEIGRAPLTMPEEVARAVGRALSDRRDRRLAGGAGWAFLAAALLDRPAREAVDRQEL